MEAGMKKVILWKILTSASIVSSLLLSTAEFSFAHELDDIRAAIKSKGARWSAGETSISKLSQQERKMRVGALKPLLSVPEQTQTAAPYLLSAPTGSFDWRNNGGTNDVTPVRDQGQCGSCWAFATTGALESSTLIHGTYNPVLDLAEQILLSCSRAGSCGGGYIDKASNFLRTTGLPFESCYPYSATNGSCSKACLNWKNSSYKIPAWHWVATTSPDVATIKNALFTYGPLVTTMNVYSDFYSYKSGVYSHVSGSNQGGHAILIIGYADDSSLSGGGYFSVKNSWGTDWGEPWGSEPGGYFRIAYSELKSIVQFGYYTIAYDASAPPPPTCTYSISPTSKSFASGGGSGSFSVTTGSACAWTAQSSVVWVSVNSGSSGTGNGKVKYAVAANKTTSSRTGSIVVRDNNSNVVRTFTITQQRARR